MEHGAADRVPHGRRALSDAGHRTPRRRRASRTCSTSGRTSPRPASATPRAGAIQDVAGFTDGDVSTAAEFNAVEGACGDGDQSPIVYDVDGSLFEDLGEDPSVIGFAGPCAVNGSGQSSRGIAVMNGIFQDGVDTASNFELTAAGVRRGLRARVRPLFRARPLPDQRRVHRSALRHRRPRRIADDVPVPDAATQQGSLSTDDIAWISRLYPAGGAGGFAATHGTITGIVYFSDGESHAQFVERHRAPRRHRRQRGPPHRRFVGLRLPVPGSSTATRSRDAHAERRRLRIANPAHIGLFEIPVPAGSYTIEVESIHRGVHRRLERRPGTLHLRSARRRARSQRPDHGRGRRDRERTRRDLIDTLPRFDDFETAP